MALPSAGLRKALSIAIRQNPLHTVHHDSHVRAKPIEIQGCGVQVNERDGQLVIYR